MMNKHQKHSSESRPKKIKKGKKAALTDKLKTVRIKPGADSSLKKVFASIGVPDKSKFIPDPFQLEALEAISKADCLVTAPTGSGKTWIAEKVIAKTLSNGGRSWYASPLKALTNAKYNEFSKIFGPENLGILTGDRKENPEAKIIAGTTEILRNQLYDSMSSGETLPVELVILDEAHFLGDPERGVVWEEIMIYLPSRISLLLLSATIGNAKHIANWLSSIRSKECIVIEEKKRPVPLFPLFFHPSGKLYPLASQRAPIGKDWKTKTKLHKKVNEYLTSRHPPLLAPPRKLPPIGEILKVLQEYDLLPAIFFLKSRADCDNALNLCKETLPQEKRSKLGKKIKELIPEKSHATNHRQLQHLAQKGVGAHHSGQLPAWKLILESLMADGILRAVFATSTVAAGVNFPARSIVLLNSDRFNGKEFLPLNSTEFHQMTGRAGRRGMDNIGFAVMIPGKFMDIAFTAKLVSASPSDVLSQIKINFSMVLNLLLSHTPRQIENLLQQSFAAYLIKKARRKKSTQTFVKLGNKFLENDFTMHLNFLKETFYVTENGELTEDGRWASRLRVDQPLMIAEGFKLGIFSEFDPALLAAIMASFVDERKSEEKFNVDSVHDDLTEAFLLVQKSLRPFAEHMAVRGFKAKSLFLLPALTIYSWASGNLWEDVLSISDTAEGNLAMLILRTADNLRHIEALKDVFPEAAQTAGKAIELIMRDPVIIDYDV